MKLIPPRMSLLVFDLCWTSQNKLNKKVFKLHLYKSKMEVLITCQIHLTMNYCDCKILHSTHIRLRCKLYHYLFTYGWQKATKQAY